MTEPKARPPAKSPPPRTLPPIVRDIVILMVGGLGFFHELLLHDGPERPMFIFASMAALGLPLALRADSRDGD